MNMERKKIQAKVTLEMIEKKKEIGYTWEHIIGLGLLASEQNPQFNRRIENLEARMDQLNKKLSLFLQKMSNSNT